MQLPVEGGTWTHETLTLGVCLAAARDFQNCTWLLYDHVHFGYSSDYIRAFYWTVVSLVTVQFGAIFPFENVECVYTFIFLFLCSIANYGALGAMSNVVTRINYIASEKRKQATNAQRFMILEGVSKSVRHHIGAYYKHHMNRSSDTRAISILKPLPANLRQEVQSFLHKNSVTKWQIFGVATSNQLRYIYAIMKHRLYKQHEFIVRASDYCDDIYIVTRGELECFLPVGERNLVPVQLVSPGYCIGEAEFVLKYTYKLSIKVVSESADVSILSRKEFATVADKFDDLWDDMETIACELASQQTKVISALHRNFLKSKVHTSS